MTPDASGLRIPKPQIYTGPKHMTVEEATSHYLRDAADRVRRQRYWGSGVTALVSDLLDSVATAIDTAEADPTAGERHRDSLMCQAETRDECDNPQHWPATPPADDASEADPLGIVTANPRPTCPDARFGRPHMWVTGAFYVDGRLIESDDYVMCAGCGQIEYEGEPGADASEGLSEAIGMSLYESLMEASADQWRRWEFLTDAAKETYRAEAARIVATAVEPVVAARVSAAATRARAEGAAEAAERIAQAFRREVDPSFEGVWAEACDLLDRIARGDAAPDAGGRP